MKYMMLALLLLGSPAYAEHNHDNPYTGESCYAWRSAGNFTRGWDGGERNWVAHSRNDVCNDTTKYDHFEDGDVWKDITNPTIERCAAKMMDGGTEHVGDHQCFTAHGKPWRRKIQMRVGYKCASLSEIRRECGVDNDTDAFIVYFHGSRSYRVYDPDLRGALYLYGSCRNDVRDQCPIRVYEE